MCVFNRIFTVLALVCYTLAYVIPANYSMDAKNLDANFSDNILKDAKFHKQSVDYKTIHVKTMEDAVNFIQTEPNIDNLLFAIDDTGELLFQYDGKKLASPTKPSEELAAKPEDDNSPGLDSAMALAANSAPFWKKIKKGGVQGAKKIKRTTHWLLQKVDEVVYEKFNGLIPVTPCVDSREGDGGSVTFSKSLVLTSDFKVEKSKKIGLNVFLDYSKTDTDSQGVSFDESITAKIPKGEVGQIFVSNPTIISGLFNQRLYRIGDVKEEMDRSSFRTKMIDNDIILEYHLLLGNANQLKCGNLFHQ